MLPILVVFGAAVLTLCGLSFAVAEHAAPKDTLPQRGASKRSLTRTDVAAIDAMRVHVMKHWVPPADRSNPEELIIKIRFNLKPDGMLAAPPRVVTTDGKTERYRTARDAAVRAIFRAQPFTMLRPVPHEVWKDVEITFDPRVVPTQ